MKNVPGSLTRFGASKAFRIPSIMAAAALALGIGGLPALAAQSAAPPAAGIVDDLVADGVDVALTGQFLVVPDSSEAVIMFGSEQFIDVESDSVDASVASGDIIQAVVEVPGDLIAELPPEALADIDQAPAVEVSDDAPLDESEEVASVLLDALADSDEPVSVQDATVLESPADAMADLPGPYQHTLHFVFMSKDGRGVFWSKNQLDAYVNGISQWWGTESRGAVSGFSYNWNDVVAVQSEAHCTGALATIQSEATDAIRADGQQAYNWTYNSAQRHLVILSPSDENTGSCYTGYAGVGYLLTNFASPGSLHAIVGANADTGAPTYPLSTFVHEMGHNFGLAHSGSMQCPAGHMDGEKTGTDACSVSNYGNIYNIMGSSTIRMEHSIMGEQKYMEGVIEDGSGYTTVMGPRNGARYTLTPARTPDRDDPQALRIIDNSYGGSVTYWVDYYDTVESRSVAISRHVPYQDRNDPNMVVLFPANYSQSGNMFFHEGETFFSKTGALRITVEEIAEESATVRVDMASTRFGLNLSQDFWDVPEYGATRRVFVDSGGAPWSITSTSPWLVASQVGTDSRVMSITAQAYPGGSRTGHVTVTSGSETATIVVNQEAYLDDCLDTPNTTCEFAFNGSSGRVDGVLGRGDDVDWWRFTPPNSTAWTFTSAASGDVFGTLYDSLGNTITFDDDSAGGRQFEIRRTLSAGQTYYIAISHFSQSANNTTQLPYTITVTREQTLALSRSLWTADYSAQQLSVNVSTDGSWSLVSAPDWITVTPASGLSGPVQIAVTQNDDQVRDGLVVFGSGNATATLTVLQSGPPMRVIPASITLPPQGGSETFHVSLLAGNTWTLVSAPTWVTVSPTSGVGGEVSVSAQANNGQARTGSIELTTASGYTQTVTVAQAPADLSLSRTAFVADSQGEAVAVEVISNVPWTVASAPAWVSVTPAAGSAGRTQVRVSVSANGTGANRTGAVTVTGGGLSATLSISQLEVDTLSVTPGLWAPYGSASTTTVNLTTNGRPWRVTSTPAWVTASPNSGTGSATVMLTARANPGTSLRSGIVAFASGAATAQVNIAQGPSPTVSVSRTTWSAPGAGGSVSATVTTNQADWTATSDAGWLTVTPTSGPSGGSFELQAQPNPSSTRTARVTVSAGGTATRTLTVTQATAPRPTLTLSRTTWSAAVGGATTTSRVTTNQASWTATSDASWLTVSPASGGTGVDMQITAAANVAAARTGHITVSVVGVTGSLTRQVTVNQTAAPRPTVTVSRITWAAPVGGGSASATVTTNQANWMAASGESWLSVTPSVGTSGQTIAITAAPNPGAARSGKITVTATGPAGTASRDVTVSQAAATITSSLLSWAPVSTGSVTTPRITTNQSSWSAVSDSDWLTMTPTSGVSDDEVQWVAERNTGARRVGTITLSAGQVTRTITVTQAAATTATVTLGRTTWSAPSSAGSVSLSVSTNRVLWSATTSEPWLTASDMEGMTGRDVVLSVSPNPTSATRKATFTVTAGTTSRSVTVTQAAGPAPLTPSQESWVAPADGGQIS
ncbi:MAG: hypothetical protein LBH48_08325, partial [Bifidobacteriaceae bacterium]|nr:hypothetical protein [Bifidobacteriaceae bacterium]